MFSLKEFKYPSDWFGEKPADDKCIYDCYKEVVDMGLFKDTPVTFQYYYGTISCTIYLYPNCNYDQLVIAARFLSFCFIVDDYLESKLISSEESREMVKKIENIFIDGKYYNKDNISDIEKYVMFFRNTTKEFVGDKIHIFNQFMKHSIDWVNSVNPFNGATNLDNYDTYNYFKKINSGTYASVSLSMVLYSNIKVDPRIWTHPRFDRFACNGGYQMATLNDCASYAKEIRNNNHLTNPLHFLQEKLNLSFEQVYNLILEFNNQIVDQICEDERILLEECEPSEREDLKLITGTMKLSLGGNYLWSLQCSRYLDPNSPFKEQRSIHKDVIGYEHIVDKIY